MDRESKIKICPHSVHSFKAVRSLLIVGAFISTKGTPEGLESLISDNAATNLTAVIVNFRNMNDTDMTKRQRLRFYNVLLYSLFLVVCLGQLGIHFADEHRTTFNLYLYFERDKTNFVHF